VHPDTLTSYNHALIVSYDGSPFNGFQSQRGGRTIQQEIERALGVILRAPVRIHCAGRTDAGVHATGQVVSFRSETKISEEQRFVHSMNALLPREIRVKNSISVPDGFHPRFSCIAREYEYLIWNGTTATPHLCNRSLWFRRNILVAELNAELAEILGEHDFASFTRHIYRNESTIRYIDIAELARVYDPITDSDNLIIFRIRGNAFLHNMIRILVGTILDRASGKIRTSIPSILERKFRIEAGQTVKPEGLFFRHAYYPEMSGVPHLKFLRDYPLFRRGGG
jgi:tRNA pseudouridine38-40 synthase